MKKPGKPGILLFESNRFRHLFTVPSSRASRGLSFSASSAATATQCIGSSPNSIAKFPARTGLRRPCFFTCEKVLRSKLNCRAHAAGLCFSSAFSKSSIVVLMVKSFHC